MAESSSANNPMWSDANLLIWANQALDLRGMQLGLTEGGYQTQRVLAALVAGQRAYATPEGADVIRAVYILQTVGNRSYEVPVWQNEQIYGAVPITALGTSNLGWTPTARLVGAEIYLEPPPPAALTDGLIWHVEALGARLTGDSSTVPAAFPSTIETLLSYDVWEIAMGVEDATDLENEADSSGVARLRATHRKIERAWDDFIDRRFDAPVRGVPFYTGD